MRHLLKLLIIALFSATFILVTQQTGFLQLFELKMFDKFLLKCHRYAVDDRIVIIGENEDDIHRFGHPISDKVVANALKILENSGARVIGVDKYRDFPISPGSNDLKKVLNQYDNIVWISFIGSSMSDSVAAPAALDNNPERVGFNNTIEDRDGIVRRTVLFLDSNGRTYYAFPLLVALHYLEKENIVKQQQDEKGNFSLNGHSLPPISSFGMYWEADVAESYQIQLQYPGLPKNFLTFSLSELLDKKIHPDTLKDKIVLVGGMAESLGDYKNFPDESKHFGVELLGYTVSQLLNTAFNKQVMTYSWSSDGRFIWLMFWCFLGAFSGYFRSAIFFFFLLAGSCLIVITHYILFKNGLWLPIVSSFFGWLFSSLCSLMFFSYFSHHSSVIKIRLAKDQKESLAKLIDNLASTASVAVLIGGIIDNKIDFIQSVFLMFVVVILLTLSYFLRKEENK